METECFTQEELEKLAYVLKAVAHPNRLKIICLLSKYVTGWDVVRR